MDFSGVQPNIYAKEVQKFPSKRCFVAVLDSFDFRESFPKQTVSSFQKTKVPFHATAKQREINMALQKPTR